MAVTPRSQILKQWGYKKETTWATPVTVDHFMPIVDFDLKSGPKPTYSNAIISGKIADEAGYVGIGDESYSFKMGGELYDHGMMALLELMLGTVATTGAGPYTHTLTPGEPLPSFTSQIAVPDSVTGTVRALTHAGSVFEDFELMFEPGKRATWAGSATAKSETNATAAATLSYPASLVPAHGQNVVVSLFGSGANVKSCKFSAKADNTYDERRFLGSAQIGAQQVAKNLRKFEADLVLELEDNFVNYLRFKNQTTGAVVITVTVGSNTTTMTLANTRFIDGPPSFKGRGIVEQPVKIEALSSGATAAVTIVCVNGDATP